MTRSGPCRVLDLVPGFVSEAVRGWNADKAAEAARLKTLWPGDPDRAAKDLADWTMAHPVPHAAVADVVAHIQHVRAVANIDHVGLGGDFDGVDSLPDGITSADAYPTILAALMAAGWTEADIRKLAGENMLRVLRAVEAVARAKADERPGMATNTAR